ncbi:MAG: DUF481 domain-containing protein [Brumimicrobium sp.]|nr:DUF481 domain-containing protein [Brumimicrobium sp.]
MDTLESGFAGDIELGLNFVQNINNVLQTRNSSHFQWVKRDHSIMSVNALNLTVFNDEKVLNDGVQYLRYGYAFNNTFDAEVFGQAQYNTIIKIQGRYLLGLGIRWHLLEFEEDSVKLHFSSHYMREYEEETTDRINRHHRLNNIVSFGWPINNQVDLNFIGYYQPDLSRFKDYRISTEFAVNIKISKRLSFKYSMAWFYDRYPPEDINRIFYNIQNSLLFEI